MSAAASKDKSKAKGKGKGKGGKTDPKAAQEEAEKLLVFKSTSRAKKLFQQFDLDKDKYLSKEEFDNGIGSFVALGLEQLLKQQQQQQQQAEAAGDGTASATAASSSSSSSAPPAPPLPVGPLTPEAIDALFLETDWDKDGRISLGEFQWRFAGGPHPSTLGKNKSIPKVTLRLQTPKRREPLAPGKLGVLLGECRDVLEALYDGPKIRYKGVDLSKLKEGFNPATFKKLLQSILAEEKAEAKEAKRPLAPWAQAATNSNVLNEAKIVERYYATFEGHKQQCVDLQPMFEQLKMRPPSEKPPGAAGGKSKKKKKDPTKAGGPQAYTLTTVKAENVRDFVSEVILDHLPLLDPNSDLPARCHPPLKHWGVEERKRRALQDEGYRTHIFLSERTKVKAIVKLQPLGENEEGNNGANGAAAASSSTLSPPSRSPSRAPSASSSSSSNKKSRSSSPSKPSSASVHRVQRLPPLEELPQNLFIFAAFRTEYTAMARTETLWHTKITMDSEENVRNVEIKVKKSWVDGELDQCVLDGVFPDWSQYVGIEDEFEELSIPPIA